MGGALAGAGAGAILGVIGSLIKKKPKVPGFTPVNAGDEAARAIAANTANLPGAKALASDVNEFSQEELLKSIRSVVPNFDQLTSNVSNQINQQVQGQLPKDVIDLINRQSASTNVSSGVAGSGFGRNLNARDLGLNSLQLIQQGIGNANQWLANARQNLTAPQFDVTSMFITPAQQIAVTAQNNANKFNVDWLTSQMNAANAPRTAIGSGFEQLGSSIGSIGLGGLGSIGGTSGAGGGGALAGAQTGFRIGG